MRGHPTPVQGYDLHPSPIRPVGRARHRLTWVWLILLLNTGCLVMGIGVLRRHSVPRRVSMAAWRSPVWIGTALLSTSSYATSNPSQAPPLLSEPIPTEPVPTAQPASGERIFLNYSEWLNVLKQEAEVTADSKPERLSILAGDSISLWFPAELLLGDRTWLNQGISGETSAGLLKRLDLFQATQPDTIFVMIGINDLIQGFSTDTVLANQELIAEDLQEQHPSTRIVIQSVLPHAGEAATWEGRDRLLTISNDDIRDLNERLAALSDRHAQVEYLDLYSRFADDQGNLRLELSTDGLHLNEKGYQLWRQVLQAYSLTTPSAPAEIQ
jgi:lysophospholipase L1-like esterase